MFNLKNYNLNDPTITWLQTLIKDNDDFDENRFEEWLKEKNVAFKSSPSAWLKTVFPKELERGTFNRIVYVPATQIFFNAMREKGVLMKQDDCMYIDIMLTTVCKVLSRSKSEGQVQDTINKWCNDCIDYIVKKVSKPSSADFINVFKQARSIKALNLDWNKIDAESKEHNEHWDKLMKEIEETQADEESMSWDEIMTILKMSGEELEEYKRTHGGKENDR